MIVTYTPDGDQAQQWEFSPGRIKSSEAEILQKRYGGTWDEFKVGVLKGDMRARRVMLFHCLRREHHTLRFEDMPDFFDEELELEFTKAELEGMRAQVAQASGLNADERESTLAALDVQIADAPEGLGKASSKN
ncbi:hypothetical protein AB0B85_11365 [Micromonospora sp. NPDC049044]|uniref:hypothetical protein n=1 Tax=Micromonospora sp. NPDC049044 TaxID=3154827 RepID=UPI0033FC8B03